MTSIDLSPLYRNSIGFDRMASLLDSALRSETVSGGYPPYNIEVLGENTYSITLAVAGFDREELDIVVDQGVLSVKGKRASAEQRTYLHQGIANRAFERKFNLADHVEVAGAELKNGMLTISLKREIPEAMKPRKILIADSAPAADLEHQPEGKIQAA